MKYEQIFSFDGIRNYADAEIYYSHCRTPSKGKRFRNWGRIYKMDGFYSFRLVYNSKDHKEFLRIYKNDIAEFIVDPTTIQAWAHTLVGHLYNALPFALYRKSTGIYRIAHLQEMADYADQHPNERFPVWPAWDFLRKGDAGYYFNGIKYDLKTGKCLNPLLAIAKPEANPDIRKQWLRDLKAFKLGFKARTKLGVMDTVATSVYNKVQQNRIVKATEWTDDNVKFVTDCIKNQSFPTKLLEMFAFRANGYIWASLTSKPTTHEIEVFFDKAMKTLSFKLRTEYGVFDSTQEKANETRTS